jgi:hypothetical protein
MHHLISSYIHEACPLTTTHLSDISNLLVHEVEIIKAHDKGGKRRNNIEMKFETHLASPTC